MVYKHSIRVEITAKKINKYPVAARIVAQAHVHRIKFL